MKMKIVLTKAERDGETLQDRAGEWGFQGSQWDSCGEAGEGILDYLPPQSPPLTQDGRKQFLCLQDKAIIRMVEGLLPLTIPFWEMVYEKEILRLCTHVKM